MRCLAKLGVEGAIVGRALYDVVLEPSEDGGYTVYVPSLKGCVSEGWRWTKLCEASFAADWDNEKDAMYDNWREVYHVRPVRRRRLREPG